MNTYFVRRIRKAILSGQDPMVFVPCREDGQALTSSDPRSLEETVERLVKRLDESPNACDCLLIAVPDETVPDETVPDEWDDYLESQYEDRTAFE